MVHGPGPEAGVDGQGDSMSTFWNSVKSNPVTALLNLGKRQAHRIAIDPTDLSVAQATQRVKVHDNDPRLGQGELDLMTHQSDDHEDQSVHQAYSGHGAGRFNGCRGKLRIIGLILVVIVVITVCGIVLLATAKMGPGVLYVVACCLSCVGVLAALGAGYVWFQKRFGHMIPGSGGNDHH